MSEVDLIHIGTSGWHYKHWEGLFYPGGMPSEGYLTYYCQEFQTVEINNTFYKLPEVDTFSAWREKSPQGFLFSVKASRYITHMKKLKDPLEPVDNFMQRVQALGDKLGPILFQLPPNWHANGTRLVEFLDTLPKYGSYTFEFRDPSWFDQEVYASLKTHNAAFCIYDINRRASPKQVTADFIYIRLHGPQGAYQGRYSTSQLAGWAGAISAWARQGKQVYCYFDNDQRGYAPQNALELKEMVGA